MVVRSALPLLLAVLTLACQKPDPKPEPQAEPAKPVPTAAAPVEAAPDTPETPPVIQQPAADPAEAQPDPIAEARPLYYEQAITDDDLQGRSLRELDLMRNTIYARIGQKFRKAWLSEYFGAQSWYAPKDDDKVDAKTLSELDLRNAEKIVDFGNAIPAVTLRERRDAINEKMRSDEATPIDEIEFQLIAARLGEWEGGDSIAERRSPLEDPDRLDELLALDDLDDFSLRDLRILRNTVYARRGRLFNSSLLQITFEDKSWYEPSDDYSGKLLTSIDRKNIRIIKSLEEELGGPISDWGHMMEEGWLYGA